LKKKALVVLFIFGALFFSLSLFVDSAAAFELELNSGIAQQDEECLACHSQPGMQVTLDSGEPLYLTVDPEVYANSVHGEQGITCAQCHPAMVEFPHPEITAENRREFTLQTYEVCQTCHEDVSMRFTNDAHQQALTREENQNLEAAVCTDCHGAHDVVAPDEPPSRIPQTCQRCHSEIYTLYKDSVHGEALLGEGNTDVPSCVDCHNAHNVQGPVNTAFRLWSPQICARCHANEELMAEYGINPDVFETYLSDFHGTTVEMFQSVAPGQETNKAVCIDCHGVHDIKRADDPQSAVQTDRLLITCQKCHPEATPNFPASWLGHYHPSPEHYPIVYFTDLFYKIFIPGVLGGMAIFVASDIFRRIRRR